MSKFDSLEAEVDRLLAKLQPRRDATAEAPPAISAEEAARTALHAVTYIIRRSGAPINIEEVAGDVALLHPRDSLDYNRTLWTVLRRRHLEWRKTHPIIAAMKRGPAVEPDHDGDGDDPEMPPTRVEPAVDVPPGQALRAVQRANGVLPVENALIDSEKAALRQSEAAASRRTKHWLYEEFE